MLVIYQGHSRDCRIEVREEDTEQADLSLHAKSGQSGTVFE